MYSCEHAFLVFCFTEVAELDLNTALLVIGLCVKLLKQKLIKWFPSSLWSKKTERYKDP